MRNLGNRRDSSLVAVNYEDNAWGLHQRSCHITNRVIAIRR
jgi:hypothetical protein